MRTFCIITLCLLWVAPLPAQSDEPPQLRYLIDLPTAGSLNRGELAIDTRAYANGGVLSGFTLGILSRLMVGVFYGGENIIGDGEINWNPEPGVDARLRVIDESYLLPAIAIGFSSQGYDAWRKEIDRYQIKPRGFYVVASRNYNLLGNFGIHGGLNYSLERSDEDKDLNLFFGIDKGILNIVEILVEYDCAWNDNGRRSVGDTHGYLNAGLRWNVTPVFATEFDFKNIANNRKADRDISRVLQLTFRHVF